MRKNLNSVYMREVIDKKITLIKDEELNCYITVKEIIDTSFPCTKYINGTKFNLTNNGYTILEYSPINENYNVRAFIDEDGNIVEYYIDIILSNSILDNEIYYEDLYLDIIYDTKYSTGGECFISLVDESDLVEALRDNVIGTEEFNLAYDVAINLMEELKQGTNKYINRENMDYFKYKTIV